MRRRQSLEQKNGLPWPLVVVVSGALLGAAGFVLGRRQAEPDPAPPAAPSTPSPAPTPAAVAPPPPPPSPTPSPPRPPAPVVPDPTPEPVAVSQAWPDPMLRRVLQDAVTNALAVTRLDPKDAADDALAFFGRKVRSSYDTRAAMLGPAIMSRIAEDPTKAAALERQIAASACGKAAVDEFLAWYTAKHRR